MLFVAHDRQVLCLPSLPDCPRVAGCDVAHNSNQYVRGLLIQQFQRLARGQ